MSNVISFPGLGIDGFNVNPVAFSTSNPSTMLNLHGNVTILCDEEAYNG